MVVVVVAGVTVEVVRGLSPESGPPVTASVGAVVLAEPELGAHVVQREADRAMYEAKRAGRDRYVVV